MCLYTVEGRDIGIPRMRLLGVPDLEVVHGITWSHLGTLEPLRMLLELEHHNVNLKIIIVLKV